MIFEANGIRCSLRIYNDRIVLVKVHSNTGATEKSIPIKDITSIQFKPGTWLTKGFMHFGYAGAKEFTGGVRGAIENENAVIFHKDANVEFNKILDLLEARR